MFNLNRNPSAHILPVIILFMLLAITCHCNQLELLLPSPIKSPPCLTKQFSNNLTGPYVVTIRRSENNSSRKEFSNTFGRSSNSREESNAVASDSTPNATTTSCTLNQTPQQAGAPASSLARKAISLTKQKRSTDHKVVFALRCTSMRAIRTVRVTNSSGIANYEVYATASRINTITKAITWSPLTMSMITTQFGNKAYNGLMQIEELRLKNKAINDKRGKTRQLSSEQRIRRRPARKRHLLPHGIYSTQ